MTWILKWLITRGIYDKELELHMMIKIHPKAWKDTVLRLAAHIPIWKEVWGELSADWDPFNEWQG